ncbi:hypothetical protein ACHAXT_012332 [Thalassiosira profunda]
MVARRPLALLSAAAASRHAGPGRSVASCNASGHRGLASLGHHNRHRTRAAFLAPSAPEGPSLRPRRPPPSSSRLLSTSVDAAADALPNKTGDRNGLRRHQIAADDGHPLRLYSRAPRDGGDGAQSQSQGRSILLLHGRTWSSQPVFDLRTSDDDAKRQSTLQSLADLGFHAYALDFRGFGETPRDCGGADGNKGGYTTPHRCVADVKCAIDWIAARHPGPNSDGPTDGPAEENVLGLEDPTVTSPRPALLGWSQGALVAQMYAQKHGPGTLSDLVLFGSIFDPKVIYPRKPLYDPLGNLIAGRDAAKPPAPELPNPIEATLEDFTLPGTICDEAALTFSSLALAVDPIKAQWDDLHEFNACNPALVHVPTLVIAGAQDPYVSWDAQRELFERLGTEDRAMCVLPGCDHAAHILKARKMFVEAWEDPINGLLDYNLSKQVSSKSGKSWSGSSDGSWSGSSDGGDKVHGDAKAWKGSSSKTSKLFWAGSKVDAATKDAPESSWNGGVVKTRGYDATPKERAGSWGGSKEASTKEKTSKPKEKTGGWSGSKDHSKKDKTTSGWSGSKDHSKKEKTTHWSGSKDSTVRSDEY